MAKITRIKAKDQPSKAAKPAEKSSKLAEKSTKSVEKSVKPAEKPAKVAEKSSKKAKKAKKPLPKGLKIITWPFRMVFTPFAALGRYIKSSWQELRQVRWPSRAATWKSVLSVLVYTGLFVALIMILDALYTLLFNNLLS